MGVITHKIDKKNKGNFNKNMKREKKRTARHLEKIKTTQNIIGGLQYFFNQANKKCQRNIPVGIDGRRRFGKIFCT